MKFFRRKVIDLQVKTEECYDNHGRQIYYNTETTQKDGRLMFFTYDKKVVLFDKETQVFHGYSNGKQYTRVVKIMVPLK